MTSSGSARHKGLILAALALAQLIIALDYSIVFVALPDIGSGVGFSDQQLQWVIGAYAVAFGGFLLLGGRMSDLLGRRRMFLTGLALYALASVLGGLASDPWVLVAARAVQGVGGAFLAPATLSLLTSNFEEGPERNRALGVWGATGSSGMVVGSLLGGVLTQAFGWAAVFFVNVPLALGVALLGLRAIPADRPTERRQGFDLPGGITVTGGALLLVFGLVQGPEIGWAAPVTLVSFVAAAALIVGFVVIESRTADPLVPLRVFSFRSLRLGSMITFAFMATFGASAYFITLALQTVRGWSALATGLAFILPCACILVGTVIGGRMSTAIGVRSTLVIGLLVGAVGTAVFAAFLGNGSTYAQMVPGIVIFSIAQGVIWTAMFSAATTGVEEKLQGLASGLATSGQQVGAAVGLAVLVAVSNAVSGSDPAPAELSDGLQAATFTSAVLILLTVGLALALPKPAAAVKETPVPAETPVRANEAV
ncbi:MFS transporter [Streptomyces corchorusii]|uniref:MFS transporter n=2 Tax=Streptomyces TaxID=1883 RepID=A0A101QM55_STRCK|nr:MFS transporter [Streptomyces corchorusii]AEY89269.1 putative transport protein [Streptomyces hygroscopicus subsp. jinggangensis 5008]AGF63427.1 putative transport protein [Streptomyces hygroscopicus subsp. jinggangensis TL01]KUN32402.1 MFS transporter [Streptomyces corchorusii]